MKTKDFSLLDCLGSVWQQSERISFRGLISDLESVFKYQEFIKGRSLSNEETLDAMKLMANVYENVSLKRNN